mgnify:FL=1
MSGASSAVDRELQNHLKRQEDRFDSRMNYLLQDAVTKRGVYDKDQREAGKALKAMYGLTGDWNDAQVAIEALGGVSKDGGNITTFIQDYQNALKENPNLNVQDVLKYTGEQQGNMTQTQAMSNMATPFSYELPAIDPKQQDQGFLSSLGFKGFRQNSQQRIMQEMKARGYNPTRAGGKAAGQAMQARAGDRQVQIQWGALGKKQQQESKARELQMDSAQATIDAAKIALQISKKNLGTMDVKEANRVEQFTATLADTRLSRRVRQQALETAQTFDAPKAKAAIAASVAATIKSGASDDMVEQFNILGSSERYYQNQLEEQENQSDAWYKTARRLTDIRVERAKLLGAGLTTAGSTDFAKINVVSFANAIKLDAVRDAGLKYELDRDGRFRILKGGTADKVYQASRNAYRNFSKSFGKSNVPQVLQQREAMKQSMYNAQSTYVSDRVSKHFKNVSYKSATHDTIPKSHKLSDGTPDFGKLRSLKPGTLVLINSQEALKENWKLYQESGNFAVWDGSALIQRKKNPGEKQAPSYHLKQTSFLR